MVEGGKSVLELLKSDFEVEQLLVTPEFREQSNMALKAYKGEMLEVKPAELAEAGEYSTNDAALALVRMKPNQEPSMIADEFILLLDDIRDPGNLGSIIRIADWYGISKIVASEETADDEGLSGAQRMEPRSLARPRRPRRGARGACARRRPMTNATGGGSGSNLISQCPCVHVSTH